jgi:hypothetical protein
VVAPCRHAKHELLERAGIERVTKIMDVYDQTGVRRAGIVDFDVLHERREWKAALKDLRAVVGKRSKGQLFCGDVEESPLPPTIQRHRQPESRQRCRSDRRGRRAT